MPQIFAPTADTWFHGIATSALIFAGLLFLTAFAPARTQYVIGVARTPLRRLPWTVDIRAEVGWYLERGQGARRLLAALLAMQRLFSSAALLLPSVRNSRQSMVVLAALTLLIMA